MGLTSLVVVLAVAAGAFCWWYGSRDLPGDIDRFSTDEEGRRITVAGRYEGFTSDTLFTSVISSSLVTREGRRVAVLTRDHAYISYEFENGAPGRSAEIFVVPRYFVTDFASIPWPASYLIAPFGDHAEAAVIHDWLYAVGTGVGKDDPDYDEKKKAARLKADLVFYKAMRESGVPRWRRRVMFGAVRIGGGVNFGADGEWYGASCKKDDERCAKRSRFVEPFLGTPIPDNCLIERDPKLYSPTGRASLRGILINYTPEDGGLEYATEIDKYIDTLWRQALSTDECWSFLNQEIITRQEFTAVRDPRIVEVEGLEEIVFEPEAAMSMASGGFMSMAMPEAVEEELSEAMLSAFGHRDVVELDVPGEDTASRRARQKEELVQIVAEGGSFAIYRVMRLYDEIEERGEAVLEAVPNSGLSVGNVTGRSYGDLYAAALLYSADLDFVEQSIREAEDAYFADPVSFDLYRSRLRQSADERLEEMENVLP